LIGRLHENQMLLKTDIFLFSSGFLLSSFDCKRLKSFWRCLALDSSNAYCYTTFSLRRRSIYVTRLCSMTATISRVDLLFMCRFSTRKYYCIAPKSGRGVSSWNVLAARSDRLLCSDTNWDFSSSRTRIRSAAVLHFSNGLLHWCESYQKLVFIVFAHEFQLGNQFFLIAKQHLLFK
jgi:hypothetical protein